MLDAAYGFVLQDGEAAPPADSVGTAWDPEKDRTIVLASLGTERFPQPVVNGRAEPDAMEFRARTTYRLRFMHISPDDEKRVSLLRAGAAVEWTPVAKDGADLPRGLRGATAAEFRPHVGETPVDA